MAMNFRYRLMQFMSGRYGSDELFFAVFAISAVLSVVNIFLRSIILQLVVYALIVYAVFRVFSRNTEQRRKENAWFLGKVGFFKRRKELHDRKKPINAMSIKNVPTAKRCFVCRGG